MSKQPLIDDSVDLTGKVALVTGANTGIGKVTARELARAGATVIFGCRSEERARQAMDEVRADVPGAQLELLPLDLSSLRQIHDAAASLEGRRIDLLINNAGVAGHRGATADGFEFTFGVNHLGHFALTRALVDNLVDGGRVVIVASKAHYQAKKGIDFEAVTQPTASRTGWPEYAVSKLANVLHARRLAEHLKPRQITVCALHPGVVASEIWRKVPWPFQSLIKLFMLSNEDGARTTLHCATHPDVVGQTGLYWDECAPTKPSRPARDDALAEELWRRSVAWVDQAT